MLKKCGNIFKEISNELVSMHVEIRIQEVEETMTEHRDLRLLPVSEAANSTFNGFIVH